MFFPEKNIHIEIMQTAPKRGEIGVVYDKIVANAPVFYASAHGAFATIFKHTLLNNKHLAKSDSKKRPKTEEFR